MQMEPIATALEVERAHGTEELQEALHRKRNPMDTKTLGVLQSVNVHTLTAPGDVVN